MAVIGLLEEEPALGIGRIVISGAEEAEPDCQRSDDRESSPCRPTFS